MPSINFVLPHWLYWGTLIVFPLIAMALSRRGRVRTYSPSIGYFILITGGLLGLHRLYLRNMWGLLFIPVFLGILVANGNGRDAREAESDAANVVASAQRVIARLEPEVKTSDERLAALRAKVDEAEAGDSVIAKLRAKKMLEKGQENAQENAKRLERAKSDLEDAQPILTKAQALRQYWANAAYYAFLALCAMIAIDAVLMPGMVRKANKRLAAEIANDPAADEQIAAHEAEEIQDDLSHIGTGWIGVIDRISATAGEFVSYWAVIAVIAYYFEVVARYVFNSPSIWVHEGMYLMFGMQYLIAGSYAALTEAHVRVDVFYADWSPLRKAVVDLLTSVFFFIFAGTLLVTGWIFAADALRVNEMSFSEWHIAYWPFKWVIVVGAALLILQGIAKLARDIAFVRQSLQGA